MTCQNCGSTLSSVLETRPIGELIRRRRACESCGNKFTTYETITENKGDKKIEFKDKGIEQIQLMGETEIVSLFREELRNAIVAEISERRKNGETFASIAKTFNCSRQNIQQYLGHKTGVSEW